MKTISAGAAGALQEFFTHSPAPLKPNRHAGCGPIFSMTAGAAGAAGEFVHLYQIKRKRKEGSKKRKFRKCSFKTPAAPAVHPKNAHTLLIYIGFLGAGELTSNACSAPAAPAPPYTPCTPYTTYTTYTPCTPAFFGGR